MCTFLLTSPQVQFSFKLLEMIPIIFFFHISLSLLSTEEKMRLLCVCLLPAVDYNLYLMQEC